MPTPSLPASVTLASGTKLAVSVESLRGIVTVCVSAPPSLQLENAYDAPPIVVAAGAVTSVVEFWMNVSVNGAVPTSAPIAMSGAPAGVLLSVRVAVLGCSWIVFEALSPFAVAVRTSSRCEGQSWFGAVNVPELDPATLEPKCVWHEVASVRAQWRMFNCHVRPAAGTGFPAPSVAWPE